jgi:hypothetical protein
MEATLELSNSVEGKEIAFDDMINHRTELPYPGFIEEEDTETIY